MTERTLDQIKDSREYKNLKRAADIMTAMSEEGCYYIVEDCYFDYGQNWMWTTIIEINPNEEGILRSCQAVNPRDWKLIVAAETKEELLEIMKKIIK